MRNSLLSDLFRFVYPPEIFPGDLAELYIELLMDKRWEIDLFHLQNDGSQNNPAEICSLPTDQFQRMTDSTSVSHTGIFAMSNGGNLSFVGAEIDQHLRSTPQVPLEDSPIVEEVVVLEESEDDIVLEIMEQIPDADKHSKRNQEVLAAAGEVPQDKRMVVEHQKQEQPKVRRRYRSRNRSKASVVETSANIEATEPPGQATGYHIMAERARRERISKKLKSLKDLISGCDDKGTDRASTLDDVIKYVERLQKKFEFLTTKVDEETMQQCNLIDQICAIEQLGYVPVFQAVPIQQRKANFPFILPATAHQILTGGQTEWQTFGRQFEPERTRFMPMQMPLPVTVSVPMPLSASMPIPVPVAPQVQQVHEAFSDCDDDLQRLVSQGFRCG